MVTDVRWKGKEFMGDAMKVLAQRMETAAGTFEARVRDTISTGGGPSAPGEPPHVDTGALRRSGEHSVQVAGDKVLGVVSFGGETAPYAQHLEFGTRKMAARPFMRPALANFRDEMLRIIRTGK